MIEATRCVALAVAPVVTAGASLEGMTAGPDCKPATGASAMQDMHLFFHNIVVYNGAASDFGKLSNRVEKAFEEQWAAKGLASACATVL